MTLRRRSLALLSLPAVAVIALTGCSATTADAASDEETTATSIAPTEAEVDALFEAWNASLATGDPEEVNAFYADDAVLLPTVSAGIHDTAEERIGYFEKFLTNEPVGEITESVVRPLSDDAVVHSGLYTFTMGASGDVVPARFTFVYQEIDGEWLIVEHQSSVEPAAE